MAECSTEGYIPVLFRLVVFGYARLAEAPYSVGWSVEMMYRLESACVGIDHERKN